MFKRKLYYNDLLKLIIKIGYDRYLTLNNALKEEYSYDEIYFYLLWQNINCFIFQRMLKFKNILPQQTDVFKDVYPLIFENIITNFEDDMSMVFINITLDLLDIWKDDDDTNSHRELNRSEERRVGKECM